MNLQEANRLLKERREAAQVNGAPSERRQQLKRDLLADADRRRKAIAPSRPTVPATAEWARPLADVLNGSAEPIPDPADDSAESAENPQPPEITIYSSLLAAMLKQGEAAAGRVWLVLRAGFAHTHASGRVSADALRDYIAQQFSFTWKRAQQILAHGVGLFWEWDTDEILRLRGAVHVAEQLGLERLQDGRVVIPLSDLTGKFKRAKAAMWAGFHAGRKSDPISRATQQKITGVCERTQREYIAENPDLIEAKSNYSIDAPLNSVASKEYYYKHGHAAFELTDHEGKQGVKGKKYLARQLPSTHAATYKTAANGSKRKDNRKLNDRVKHVAYGNVKQTFERVFYQDRVKAAKVANRCPLHSNQPVYMQIGDTRRGGGIWVNFCS